MIDFNRAQLLAQPDNKTKPVKFPATNKPTITFCFRPPVIGDFNPMLRSDGETAVELDGYCNMMPNPLPCDTNSYPFRASLNGNRFVINARRFSCPEDMSC